MDDYLALFLKANPPAGSASGRRRFKRGDSLSQSDIEEIAREAGFPESDIKRFGAIGMAESNGNTRAFNPGIGPGGKPTKEKSVGLFQVNTLAHPQYDREWLEDPYNNAKAALEIYRKQGLRAWGAYTDGRYKKFYRGGQGSERPTVPPPSLDYTQSFIQANPPSATPQADPMPADFTEMFIQANPPQQQQRPTAPLPSKGVPAPGFPPNPSPTQISGQIVQAPQPATETLQTVEQHAASAKNPQSPRAAVLFPDEAQARFVDPSLLQGLEPARIPQGGLYVNEQKARQMGVTDYARDMAKLIGKVEDVGEDTGHGQVVVTLDKDGNELASSKVTSPFAAAQQARIDKASFPNAAEQRIVDAQDLVAKRTEDAANEMQAIETLGGLTYSPQDPFPDAGPEQPQMDTLSGQTPDQAYAEYAEFARSQNLPVMTREQFDAEAKATEGRGQTQASAYGITPPKVRTQGQRPQGTQDALQRPQYKGESYSFPRQVGTANDDLNAEAGVFTFDKTRTNKIEIARDAISAVGSRYGVTPAEADAYVRNLTPQQKAAIESFDLDQGKVTIPFSVIADIKGEDAIRGAVRQEQAEARVDPDIGQDLRVGRNWIQEDAEWLNSNAGSALVAINPIFAFLEKDQRDKIASSLVGGAVGSGARTARALAGIARPISGDIYQYMQGIAESGEGLERQTGDNSWTSTLVKIAGGAPSDLSRLYLFTRVPGGVIVGMGAEMGLQSAGRGESWQEVAKQTVKGGTLGAVFMAAPIIGRLTGEYPVATATANVAAQRVGREIGTVAAVGLGSGLVESTFGSSEEQALQTAVINSLFYLAQRGVSLQGKVVRGRDKDGNEVNVGIDPDGNIRLLKGTVKKPDGEVYVDKSPIQAKETQSAGNRGNRLDEGVTPKELRDTNPQRIETADPTAVQKAKIDTRTRKVADYLQNRDFTTVDEIAKATRLNKSNVEDAVMTLYGARLAELLPGNRVRLIDGESFAAETDIFTRAQQYGQTPKGTQPEISQPAAPVAQGKNVPSSKPDDAVSPTSLRFDEYQGKTVIHPVSKEPLTFTGEADANNPNILLATNNFGRVRRIALRDAEAWLATEQAASPTQTAPNTGQVADPDTAAATTETPTPDFSPFEYGNSPTTQTVQPKTPEAMIRPKHKSLAQFVRSMGGIRPDSEYLQQGKGKRQGELDRLSIKQLGTTGLINSNSAFNAEDMARRAWDAGYIREYAEDAEYGNINPEQFLALVEDDFMSGGKHFTAEYYEDLQGAIDTAYDAKYESELASLAEMVKNQDVSALLAAVEARGEITNEERTRLGEYFRQYNIDARGLDTFIGEITRTNREGVGDQTGTAAETGGVSAESIFGDAYEGDITDDGAIEFDPAEFESRDSESGKGTDGETRTAAERQPEAELERPRTIKDLSPAERSAIRRDLAPKEHQGRGRLASQVAEAYNLDRASIEKLAPLGEVGKFGQTSHIIKASLAGLEHTDAFNSLARIFLPEVGTLSDDDLFAADRLALGTGILDEIASEMGVSRSSHMTPDDWGRFLDRFEHALSDDAINVILSAVEHQALWHANIIKFTEDPELDIPNRRIYEIGQQFGWEQLANARWGAITTEQFDDASPSYDLKNDNILKKEVLRIGRKYGIKESKGQGGLSDDWIKRAYLRAIQRTAEEKLQGRADEGNARTEAPRSETPRPTPPNDRGSGRAEELVETPKDSALEDAIELFIKQSGGEVTASQLTEQFPNSKWPEIARATLELDIQDRVIPAAGKRWKLAPAKQAPKETPKAETKEPVRDVAKEKQADTQESKDNPFRTKAIEARSAYERLSKPSARDEAMRESFPLGVGYGRPTDKSIDRTVSNAVEATRMLEQAERYERLADAFDRGEVNAQGRPPAANAEEAKAKRDEKKTLFENARAAREGRAAWEVPLLTYAHSHKVFGGRPMDLTRADHQAAVEKALAEGKPVPAEVLADYPDLAEKAGEKVEKPAERKLADLRKQLETETHNPTVHGLKWRIAIQEKIVEYNLPFEIDPEADFPLGATGRAFQWNSMDPDRMARGVQRDYVEVIGETYKQLAPLAKTPEQQAILDAEIQRFRDGYIAKERAVLAATAKTASWMVTGPARFPVEKNRRALDRERAVFDEALDWRKKAVASIKKKLLDARTDEVKTDERWGDLKAKIDRGFTANIAGVIERLADNGEVELVNRTLDYLREVNKKFAKPLFTDRHKVWTFGERAQKAADKVKPTGTGTIAEFDGGTVVNNRDAERVQILFDERPSPEVIRVLKKNGWRWSPSNGAWQRQNTANGIANVSYVLRQSGIEARTPTKDANDPLFNRTKSETPAETRDLASLFAEAGRTPQTDTPEFKKWFGDSKVVDENGKPLVVYHGTPTAGFDQFDTFPAYFSPDPDIASIYTSSSASSIRSKQRGETGKAVMPVYLSLQNPFDTRIAEHRRIFEEQFYEKGGEEWSSNGTPLTKKNLPDWTDARDLADFIEEEGLPFDGIIVDEGGMGGYGEQVKDRGIAYVVLKPTQIKSAIGNSGAFDPNEPSILLNQTDLFGNPLDMPSSQGSLFDTAEVKAAAQDAVRKHLGTVLGDAFRYLDMMAKSPDKKIRSAATLILEKANYAGNESATTVIGRAADGLDLYARAKQTKTPLEDMLRQQWIDPTVTVSEEAKEFARAIDGGNLGKLLNSKLNDANRVLLQAAWHGSPHTFDKFSLDKIGTGEGNQAYGYGLYFTDQESTAQHYKDKLASSYWDIDGIKYESATTRISDGAGNVAADALDRFKGDKQKAIKWLNDYGREGEAKTLLQNAKSLKQDTGAIYRVNLKPAEDKYLLWDKPLSEQSGKVKQAIKSAARTLEKNGVNLEIQSDRFGNIKSLESDILGRDIYRQLAWGLDKNSVYAGDQKAASEYLKSLGIRGIKYLDGSSRGKGEGNYNYVIFDDADVEIEEVLFNAAEDRAIHRQFRRVDANPVESIPKAKITVNPDTGVTELNIEGLWIMNKAFQEVGLSNTGFRGAYIPKMKAALLLDFLSRIPQFASIHKTLTKAANSSDYGDLTIAYTDLRYPVSTAATVQEELGHRADMRTQIDLGGGEFDVRPYQGSRAYQKAFATLTKMYEPKMIHREILGKIRRDDAAEELGITEAEVAELLDIRDKELSDSGLSAEAYDARYGIISPANKRRAEKYAQQKATRTSGLRNGERKSEGEGDTLLRLENQRNARTRSGETRPPDTAEARTRPVKPGLRRSEVLSTDRRPDESLITPAEAKFIRIKAKGSDALQKELTDTVLFAKAGFEKLRSRDLILDILSAPKSAKSSVDISAAGRQGWITGVAHPILAIRAFRRQLPVLLPRSGARSHQAFKQWLQAHPFIELADASKLFLATLAGESSITEREEAFMSRLLGNDPYFKNKKAELARKAITFHVRASERAFNTYLDHLRIETFQKLAKQLHDHNVRTDKADDIDQYKGLAKFINYATGRGDLGSFNEAAPYLNAGFFSVRFWASRLQVMNPIFYAKLPPGTRSIVLKDAAKFIAGVAAILLLLDAAGADVEWDDPNNPAAFKIGFGRYKYQIDANLIKHLRYLWQMAKGDRDRTYLTERYVRGTLAPVPSAIWSSLAGKNFIGEPTSWKEQAVDLFKPISVSNYSEAMKYDGAEGLLRMMPETLGFGTSRYKDSEEILREVQKEAELLRQAKTQEERNEHARRMKIWERLMRRAQKYEAEDRQKAAAQQGK